MLTRRAENTFSFSGWVAGWLEIWRVKLISTQVVVEVEVGVELGNIILILNTKSGHESINKNSLQCMTGWMCSMKINCLEKRRQIQNGKQQPKRKTTPKWR